MAESNRRLAFNAGQIVVFGFLVGNVIGTLLLMLPISVNEPGSTNLMTASFTSVSALSLTGLGVVDTAVYWSGFGQFVIMALIQIGGFGIMAIGSMLVLFITQKVSFRTKLTSTAEQKALGLDDFRHLLVRLFQISFAVEALLALVLGIHFWLNYNINLPDALWHGLFHSVAAFNNAGFSNFEGGLIRFAADPIVLHSIAITSIIGGLGFPVLIEVTRRLFRRLRIASFRASEIGNRLSLNSRIVLQFTVALLVLGAVFTAAIEWNNPKTLGTLSIWDKLHNAWFASAMARTTGFASLDYGKFNEESLLITDILMFIGGGSAGTSGGLRITTFAVLIFVLIAEIRGYSRVNAGNRRLGVSVQRTAVALTTLSIIWVGGMVVAMQLITDFSTDQILFEVLSAFGTCGLSTGITPLLPEPAKILLMVMMFTGRIGLVLVATALAGKAQPLTYKLPKERPLIG